MKRPIVFLGPSGIGKGTIENQLFKLYPDTFSFSVSHTTRSPRAGETDGKEYYFTTLEQMEKDIAEGKFVEYTKVHGRMYGTSFMALDNVQKSGKICILDLNVDGALAFSSSEYNPLIILLLPVSLEALEARLRARGTEGENEINTRMNTAREEMKRFEEHKDKWDMIIFNDAIEDTIRVIQQKLHEVYGI